MKNMEYYISILLLLLCPINSSVLHKKYAKIRGLSRLKNLPVVPPVVYPPVPDEVKISFQDQRELQDNEEDPEARPGLFQGDMALTNEVSLICDIREFCQEVNNLSDRFRTMS